MNDESSGRRLLLLLGGVVVLLSGLVGFFVGGAASSTPFEVFGTAVFPRTPLSVTLYAMLLAAVVMGGLFVAVEFASRFDDG